MDGLTGSRVCRIVPAKDQREAGSAAVVVLAMLLGALSSLVQADSPVVYRCDLPGGVTAFSDRYCGPDAVRMDLTVAPPQGVSLGSAGDFAAVERDNAQRERQRRSAWLRQQQGALREAHRAQVSALEQRLASLPDNALRASTVRDLKAKRDTLEDSYRRAQRRLSDRHRALVQLAED